MRTSPELGRLVAPVFAADERVRLAYLFGSVAAPSIAADRTLRPRSGP